MPAAAKKKEVTQRRSSTDMLSMRVPDQTRILIDSAAQALGKSRTEFMLETARARAEEVILDQRMFDLDEVQTVALMALFDKPPETAVALRQLMTGRAPWE